MPWLHYEHARDEACTTWCYWSLPRRRGATIVHCHDEGESCDPAWCYYQPSLGGAIKAWWRRWAGDAY